MQGNTTYFDDTRYDNLTSLESNGAKLAKLSAIDKFTNNANKIKEDLKSNVEVETAETTPVTPEVEVTPTAEVKPTAETEVQVEPTVEHPTKEALEAKTEGITFYNGLENASSDGLGRKLRVKDPEVTESLRYATNTLGVEYTIEAEVEPTAETEVQVEPTVETELETSTEMPPMETEVAPETEISSEVTPEGEPEMSVEAPVEQPQTFDFSALPGVGEPTDLPTTEVPQEDVAMETEQPTYEEHMTTEEQDNRLNDYLNRDTSMDVPYTNNNSDLEEIRKLKREIEEARRSLQQVKGNVSDLQQKDNRISEQLAMLKQSLIDEKNAVNQEILAETTEWNNLTQLVREKEALMGDEEFTKSKVA